MLCPTCVSASSRVSGLAACRALSARPCDLRQYAQFMSGIAADSFDERRDEVVAVLELHVDIREGCIAALVQRHQSVVRRPDETGGCRHAAADDKPNQSIRDALITL